MSTRVGEVELYVDLDGRRLPAQTRRLGDQIGRALDAEFKKAGKSFDQLGIQMENRSRGIMRAIDGIDFGHMLEDIGELRRVPDIFTLYETRAISAGHSTAELGDHLDETNRRSRRFRDGLAEATAAVGRFMGGGGGGSGIRALSGALGDNSIQWSEMSHNARQWTLIIAAVAAGMQDIAVLGSAAGAGLVALGGAATSGIFGITGLAATFVTLNKELGDLPPEMRPVASEFQRFKGVFGELRQEIASGAFTELPGTFSGLYVTLKAATPQMRALGTASGKLIAGFERGIRPGTEAFSELTELAEHAVPNFSQLARTSGTLGLALTRSFNRSQPLVEDMLRYVDRLVERFDSFSRGTGFDRWMSNASITFGAFGRLVDATGRSLNDLVTPEAVGRTAEFLDNLTGFMPNLTLLLDNLGRLDAFGIAAAALNEMGDALSPLAPVTGVLADSIRDLAMNALPGFADGLHLASTLLAPTIELAARFIDSVPPEVIYASSYAIGALAGAFVILKGAEALGGAVVGMRAFGDLAKGLPAKVSGAVAVLGRAGLVGALAAGALAFPTLIDGMVDYLNQLSGLDGRVSQAVRTNLSFVDTLTQTGQTYKYNSESIGALLSALSDADGSYKDITQTISYFGETSLQTQAAAGTLVNSIAKIDESFLGLSVDQSVAKFSAWKDELGLSDTQARQLISLMPNLEATLQGVSETAAGAAVNHDLLKIATGQTASAMQQQQYAAQAAAEQLAALQGQSGVTGEAIDSLAEKIRGFGSATLSTREANREMEAAVAALTESLNANGVTLDISTAAGRANEAAIDDLAKSVLEQAAATVEQTGKQADANRVIFDGRQRLIEMLGQFGITGQAADDYVNKLGLIPGNVDTALNLQDSAARASVDRFIRDNDGRSFRIYANTVYPSGGNTVGRAPAAFASGGTLYGPELIYAGEAGPEAIVPLNRPLHDVDPSVRLLSAIAQGKLPASAPAERGAGAIFQEGAIVVQGALDPRRTAIEVQREIVEAASS